MITEQDKAIDEAQIQQLADDWLKALRAKDINGLMSHYVPDILLFDILPPLEHKGISAYRKIWSECLPYFQGSIDCEIRDLNITVGLDVAFSHSLNRMSGTTTNGKKIDNWLRVTVCYRKIDGRWMVVHEHISVPIDMDTTKALFDLKP